jgi:hypothetical protein
MNPLSKLIRFLAGLVILAGLILAGVLGFRIGDGALGCLLGLLLPLVGFMIFVLLKNYMKTD